MAMSRHLAINRRLVQLAEENAALSQDVGKLEEILGLHKTLTSQQQSSTRKLNRKDAHGSIWQFGGGGKLKNFKGKQDIKEGTTGADWKKKSLASTRKKPPVKHVERSDPPDASPAQSSHGSDQPPGTELNGCSVGNPDCSSGGEVAQDGQKSEARPAMRRRRRVKSVSASGLRSKVASPAANQCLDVSATGRSIKIPERDKRTCSASRPQGEGSRVDSEGVASEETLASMKEKLVKKVLSNGDVEKKLKGYMQADVEDTASTEKRKGRSVMGTTSECVDKASPELDPQIEEWLEQHDLHNNTKCKQVFKKHNITFDSLKTMKEYDFRVMGIVNVSTLLKIREGLSQLKISRESSGRQKETELKSDSRKTSHTDNDKIELHENDDFLMDDPVKDESSEPSQRPHTARRITVRPAWGSSNTQARPSTSRVRPKSRPQSAKSGASVRHSTVMNKDALTKKRPPTAKQQPKKRKDSEPLIQVTGGQCTSKLTPVGIDDTLLTEKQNSFPDSSQRPDGRKSPAKSSETDAKDALERMREQIRMLQQRARNTGDSDTMALVTRLQAQLVHVQQMVAPQELMDGLTAPSPAVCGTMDDEPGSFISAALQGNVRPAVYHGRGLEEMDPEDDDRGGGPDFDKRLLKLPVKDEEYKIKVPPAKVDTTPITVSMRKSPGEARGTHRKAPGPDSTVLNMSMSKGAILKEVRKQADQHRQTVRHLESELARLKHRDPLRSSEVAEEDVEFHECDLIGEGAFSQVFKGMFQGSEVAVKRLKIPLSAQDKNYFMAEVNLLRELRHPRVILLLGVCTTSYCPLMVLEYMSGGSLYSYLHDQCGLDHAAYYQVAQDIAVGMNFLHRHRPIVLHLDLKSLNVLLTSDLRAKIADFGFSKLRHDADLDGSQRKGVKGTPAWMAPELLDGGAITTKADVYSYGIILWEMITHRKPYEGCSTYQVIERVRSNQRLVLPETCPTALEALITSCWDQSPARRPSFEDILHHLGNLRLPPKWKSLFAAAGLSQGALNDVETTRALMEIVSETMEQTDERESAGLPSSRTERAEVEDYQAVSPKRTLQSSISKLQGAENSDVDGSINAGNHVQAAGRAFNGKPTTSPVQNNSVMSDQVGPVRRRPGREDTKSSTFKSKLNNVANQEREKPSLGRVSSSNFRSAAGSDAVSDERSVKPSAVSTQPLPAPPPPPPPPPLPPPDLPSEDTNQKRATPTATPAAPVSKPAGSTPQTTFMSQLKENLKDVKLRPVRKEDSGLSKRKTDETRQAGVASRNAGPGRAAKGPASSASPGGFSIAAAELVNKRKQLRRTDQSRPRQLQDLNDVSDGALKGLADVLRKAVSDRRVVIQDSISVDRSIINSGWSSLG